MSEIAKCPVCGNNPVIYPTHDKSSPWPEATECCGAAFQTVKAWNQYAALLARHSALVEAVAWERECEAVRNQLRPFRNWPELAESVDSYQAARAEVDRLIAESEGGDETYLVGNNHFCLECGHWSGKHTLRAVRHGRDAHERRFLGRDVCG